jgi:hypothetical protein
MTPLFMMLGDIEADYDDDDEQFDEEGVNKKGSI